MGRITGKWALVTGSSRGIGQQIAVGLAREGANVIVHGRSSESVKVTLGLLGEIEVETRVIIGELSSSESVDNIIAQLKDTGVPIDILFNNAGIMSENKSLYDFRQADWDRVFQVNVWAPIAICRAVVSGMKQRGWGRVVNLTSGIRDQPNLAPYGMSKAAINKYTEDLAADLRGSGVLANYLDPGWLKTDMGGPNAMFDVQDVLPGALIPVLLEDGGPSGQFFAAMDYRKP